MARGRKTHGETLVPDPINGFRAFAAGWQHSVGPRQDGSAELWGDPLDIPRPNSGFVAIAAGTSFNLAVKVDGTLVAWGTTGYGQSDVPPHLGGVFAVAAADLTSIAISGRIVPVAFRSLVARSEAGTIILRWRIAEDGVVRGFPIHRSDPDGVFRALATQPLPPETRTFCDASVIPGRRYRYKVTMLPPGGETIESAETETTTSPLTATLYANYPNPFNVGTTISFSVPDRARVRPTIHDAQGHRVNPPIDRAMPAGRQNRQCDGTDSEGREVASGMYFCRLVVGDRVMSRKMTLLE